MASHERERLLPSELFQDHDVFSEDNNNNTIISPKGLRSFESTFSYSGSACSSWSDFSSPLSCSELGSTSESTESEDEELFISELSRQMAEYMLQDDDDDDAEIQDHENITVSENSESDSVNWSESKWSTVCDYNTQEFLSKSENRTSDQVSTDGQLRSVQVYQLKNQPQMRKQQQGSGHGGRRVKAAESTQQFQLTEHHQNMQNKGKAWRYGLGKKSSNPLVPSPPGGSGMRAVFLAGSERNGSSGTGVFLPSGTYTTAPEPKKKSGCSTVLIPARVLQMLQQHFNAVGGMSPSNTSASASHPWQHNVLARINGLLSQQKEHAEFQTRPAWATTTATATATATASAEINHQQEVKLPQEWTY